MSADDKKYRAVQIIRGMLAAAGKKGVSKHLLWTELEIQGVKPTRATDLMVLVRKANARKLEEAKGILYSNDAFDAIQAERAVKNPLPPPGMEPPEGETPNQITIIDPSYVRVGLRAGGDWNFNKGVIKVVVYLAGTITGFLVWWHFPVERLIVPMARAIGWPL